MLRAPLASAALLLTLASSQAGPLEVLRVTPTSPADPLDEVTVTFDRPVAGGLDETVDAAAIFSIDPAVPGTVEWRDPVTLRFTPDAPLESGTSYTIRIAANAFEAMDGSRLGAPYEYTFEVSPPQVLDGVPVGPWLAPRHLPPRPVFSVLLSAAPDPMRFAGHVRVKLGARCGGGTVGVRALGEPRRIGEDDPPTFRYRGRRVPVTDTIRDLRRVLDLTPISPLPGECADTLLLPELADGEGASLRWPFTIHGSFRLESVTCPGPYCPTGPVMAHFSTPVQGAEVLRHVRIEPDVPFTVGDTANQLASWALSAAFEPRHRYTISVDADLTDVFGQRIEGTLSYPVSTTGYAPTVGYEYGRMVVEREGLRTLAVQHVNVDTLLVSTLAVPDSLEPAFLAHGWGWGDQWNLAADLVRQDTITVAGGQDERRISGVRLGVPERSTTSGGSLLAVKISSPALDSLARRNLPIALVQVTDLAVTARVGVEEAVAWVTGVHDGTPRPGASVSLHDFEGRVLAQARSNAEGLAVLKDFEVYEDACEGWQCYSFEGYVSASLDADRAVVPISAYDPDLSPWRFNVYSAWGESRAPLAAAVFTERGIYRPGEPVYAKAIVRRGTLGALEPPQGDSVRWLFHDRESGTLRDTVTVLSAFGTTDETMTLPQGLPLGTYDVEVQVQRDGDWRSAATAWYQVGEYRPPEFLVDVTGENEPKLAGDSTAFQVSARYLFGAPMAHAPVSWNVHRTAVSPWAVRIPGVEDYQVGVAWNWWEEGNIEPPRTLASGTDTLDAAGAWDHVIGLSAPEGGRPARVTLTATVTDANRQIASSSSSVMVHPAAFYLGLKSRGDSYFWTAGTPVGIDVVAVEPGGGSVSGVSVEGTVVRREWHRVRRERNGLVQEVGAWVADTVATCRVVTAGDPVACGFTPPDGGSYTVLFTAQDAEGRPVQSSINRWASGPGWVPWNDESQFKMDVIPDQTRYSVGDTATVFFAVPFTDAEAWVTVERERVLEQQRIRITDGATTLKFPITEGYAPNVFVSMVVVRGRSAEPGPLDDPGRPTLRVGYAELRVAPEVKRLEVDLQPLAPEYRPGDTVSVEIQVRDAGGRGHQSEVTVWAVDEGVLALTGYQTPDPIDLLYPPRGLGMRLASNLVSVAPQVPEGQKGNREPGGGGGLDLTGILRSQFRSTAFFLGSVVTDESGHAVAEATLPDNVTTFRIMAVAVSEGDRYGSGESELLATLPLLARPALPRFVREDDRFRAGVVVNSRMGGRPEVEVEARAEGIELEGRRRQNRRLAEGRGADFRFEFRAVAGDSARFRFDVSSGREADAVAVAVPVRPSYLPLSRTVTGVTSDSAIAAIELQPDVDPRRSSVEVSLGASPLAIIRSAGRRLQVYPYSCTEQVASGMLPLVALLQAEDLYPGESLAPRKAREQVRQAVRVLEARQRPDGAIGYWGGSDWSSPWLSAYAGRVLLEARKVGVSVSDSLLVRLGGYLSRALHDPAQLTGRSPVSELWLGELPARLGEQLAAADLLSRMGQPDVAVENTLLTQVSRMRWEDRVLLVQVLARRADLPGRQPHAQDLQIARSLLGTLTRDVEVEGRMATLPDSVGMRFYFPSRARPAARLLEALLELEPQSPLVGPLVETLAEQGRLESGWYWNTQDVGSTVLALLRYEGRRRELPPSRVEVRAGDRTLLQVGGAGPAYSEASSSLRGLVERGRGDQRPLLRVSVDVEGEAPVYFFVTVHEAPEGIQLTPMDRGIQVERWYESVTTGSPIVAAEEGEVVRVRLRLRVQARRTFVVLDDPLPAGLEPVDLSLRTLSPFGATVPPAEELENQTGWYYGSWDSGMWSAFDHKEIHDDRVVYSATVLWPGTYTATYLARATAAGTFLYPPAHAEEMYNPGVNGRSGGGTFTVRGEGR